MYRHVQSRAVLDLTAVNLTVYKNAQQIKTFLLQTIWFRFNYNKT